MGSGLRKKKKGMFDYYTPLDEDVEAMEHCIKNNIRIFPIPQERGMDPSSFKVGIAFGQYTKNEKVNESPEVYPKEEIAEQLYKFMRYYYEKHRG